MDIVIIGVGKYNEVLIKTDSDFTLNLGLFDKEQSKVLALKFEEASDELLEGYDA